MMAFVEDIAQRAVPAACRWSASVASQSLRGLRDHQRVIGDDDGRMAGAADGALDETDAIMRAGGIDAFAAPVGDFATAACDAAEKGGKARAGHIAIGAGADPARDQAQRHAALPGASAVRLAASSKFSRQR